MTLKGLKKTAFAIILAGRYTSYDSALTLLNMTSLTARRGELNLKFAQKCLKSEKFSHWFCKFNLTDQASKTRSEQPNLLEPVKARTKGLKNSPIAYLTRLLNENHMQKK